MLARTRRGGWRQCEHLLLTPSLKALGELLNNLLRAAKQVLLGGGAATAASRGARRPALTSLATVLQSVLGQMMNFWRSSPAAQASSLFPHRARRFCRRAVPAALHPVIQTRPLVEIDRQRAIQRAGDIQIGHRKRRAGEPG